jgi:hypothetical protein
VSLLRECREPVTATFCNEHCGPHEEDFGELAGGIIARARTMPEQDRTAPRLRCAYRSEPMLRRGCFAAVARALSAICFSCQLSIQHLGFAARQFQQVVQIFHVAGVEGFNGTSHSGASRGVIPLRHGAFRKLRAERSRALAPLHFIVAEHFLDRVGEAARRGRSSGIF